MTQRPDASELAVEKQSERATRPASAAERRGNPPDSLPFSAADAFNPLLGLALGDQIGGPIRMSLILGDSLSAQRGLDLADLATRYLTWHQTGAFDSGPTWAAVFARHARGMPIEQAAAQVHAACGGLTAGTNPAHRVAPIGCLPRPPETLAAMARAEARLTHLHPDAGEAAAAVALLIHHLLAGEPWPEARRRTAESLVGSVACVVRGDVTGPLSPGGYAPETLRAALWFMEAHSDFTTALDASFVFAGPANYCPVLVGALAATRWGVPAGMSTELAEAARGCFRSLRMMGPGV